MFECTDGSRQIALIEWTRALACTLRNPPGLPRITEVAQTLYLCPKDSRAGEASSYAFSLFPERLEAEDKAELNVSLGPELTFASGAGFSVGQLGATIEYRKVFPVIQSYGVWEPASYWIFRPHRTCPLDGRQFVYAVVVAMAGAGGIRASVELAGAAPCSTPSSAAPRGPTSSAICWRPERAACRSC